ncbi:MAG: lysophospholipid acyltransferase family protein [Oceanipulchritudo sp.]
MKTRTIPKPAAPDFADYETSGHPVSPCGRLFPTPAFYSRVSLQVFLASFRARRGRFDDYRWHRASLKVRRAFERAGARVSIRGTGHIARLEGPCLFIGNHMSTAETFLLASMILPFRPVTFVVKRSLVEYPVFKHVMRSRDPVVVGRSNPREDLKAVIGGGQERLKAGISIVIFPQHTRTVEFDRESFNTIGVKLARRAGVPVIPLALKTNAWSNGKWLKDYGPFHPEESVHFEFGEPIRVGNNEREVHEAVIAFIESRLEQWSQG